MLQKRRAEILARIRQEKMVTVTLLADEYKVSEETIRRDLVFLESKKYLKRVYGGAVLPEFYDKEPAYEKREGSNQEQKVAIAKAASTLINDDDVLFIDNGTTCLELAKQLADKNNLTVITYSLLVAKTIAENETAKVFLLGGQLRKGEMSVSGFLTNNNLSDFFADKVFIGAGGITVSDGVTDYHPEETNIRRKMIAHSKSIVVLADYTKFGISAMNAVCPVVKIDTLITDSRINKDIKDQYRKSGVNLIIAADN
ncbi:MAG: DeoR/GlpR family DNA-binding transcription regulator [Treponema sp.]|jgi:DeoR/GlpR family transcriptional regulator of sugar metabolism|nr:DeoR/GlpR family DNA-binding transcription regulator [Treponema sp.]